MNEFANQEKYDSKEIVRMSTKAIVDQNLDKLPWYLFRDESIGIILWEILMGLPLLYVFIAIPILQAIEAIEIPYEPTKTHLVLHEISEAMFMFDLVFSFFKVP